MQNWRDVSNQFHHHRRLILRNNLLINWAMKTWPRVIIKWSAETRLKWISIPEQAFKYQRGNNTHPWSKQASNSTQKSAFQRTVVTESMSKNNRAPTKDSFTRIRGHCLDPRSRTTIFRVWREIRTRICRNKLRRCHLKKLIINWAIKNQQFNHWAIWNKEITPGSIPILLKVLRVRSAANVMNKQSNYQTITSDVNK